MGEQPSPEKILQPGMAFWASKTLLSVIELGLSKRQEALTTQVPTALHGCRKLVFLRPGLSRW
jgi:hypothetical protein